MIIQKARELAEKMHEGQFRADGITPYIEHPRAVAALVDEMGGNDEDICLAWLHDILEESSERVGEYLGCEMTLAPKFIMGAKKAGWDMGFALRIKRLSNIWDKDEIEQIGKSAYLAKVLTSSGYHDVLVKLCDMVCNMRESNGSHMTQEKRYYMAAKCLEIQNRLDMDTKMKKLMCEIDSLYINHLRENEKNGK